jgi:hypothetical protein
MARPAAHRTGKEGQDVEDQALAFQAPGSLRCGIGSSGRLRAFIVLFGFNQIEHLVKRFVGFLDRPVQLDNQDGKTNICKRSPID